MGLAFGRSRWRELLKLAASVGAAMRDARTPDQFQWADFKARLEKTPPSGLPLDRWGVSGAQAYQAFLSAGRGLVVAAEPRRQRAFGVMVIEAAKLLEDLLDDAASQDAAASWGRQFPREAD
jgi:hypothetical protein